MPACRSLPFLLMFFRSARLSAFLLVLLVAALPAREARAAGVIFRYLPGQPTLSSSVVAANLQAGIYLDPRDLVARGPGGWGLRAPYTAEFQAPGATLRSTETAALSQALGPRLTAEVWIKHAASNGRVTLLNNQISGSGSFDLGLDGATPYFILLAGGREIRVDAGDALADGETAWIAATARFDVSSQRLHLTLYVNGHVAGTTAADLSIPSPYVIARPFFVGTEATGTPDTFTLEGRFTGHLFAALVRDYVAADAYLTSSVPLDGSFYHGLPAFHDYDLGTFHLPMDQRIRAEVATTRHRFFVPYVNDEFVPQGTATHVEVHGSDTTALVYLAYYHLTRDGKTGQRRSMIAEMDAATGHVRRTFRLMGTLGYSHAGGIAYVKDALYVSSSSTLERYPLPAYEGPDAPRYLDLAADASGTISVYGRASFVSEHRDTLWVGDWRTASQNAPYLYGYPLASDGRPVPGGAPQIYALPRGVQGVDFFVHRGETYAFMSRNVSQSRGVAEILRVPRSRLERWREPTPDSSITVPYGIEDLSFFPDGTLWTNSESSADYYQKSASAWSVFYPFVYSLPARAIFGEDVVTSAIPSPAASGETLRLTSAPNPFRAATTLTVDIPTAGMARLRVTDVLGRHVTTLFDGPVAAGTRHVRWDAAGHAAGLYFVVLETPSGRVVQAVTLAR